MTSDMTSNESSGSSISSTEESIATVNDNAVNPTVILNDNKSNQEAPIVEAPVMPSTLPIAPINIALEKVSELKPPSNDDSSSSEESSAGGSEWYEQKLQPRKYFGAENLDQIEVGGKNRSMNDVLLNEMQYSDFNRMPPSFNSNDYEYGYSFIPPKDWYPVPPYPPVCVTEKTCPVCPIYTDTDTMNLKDWNEARRITPPDVINTVYIKEKLNSGR